MSTTRIENNNTEEDSNESFVLDTGASGHYYPTAFDEESPNDGSNQGITTANGSIEPTRRTQGNGKIVITEFKNEFTRLLSVGALVRQQHEHPADLLTRRTAIDGRIRQIYARNTIHVRPNLPSPERIRLSAAGNRIQHIDISTDYLHLNFTELSVTEQQRIGRANYLRNFW